MSEHDTPRRPGYFREGFVTHNPIFATFLGLCPSLAVTAVVHHAFVLSVVVAAVLLLSALSVSLLRTVVQLRFQRLVTLSLMGVFAVIATLVVSFYMPAVSAGLGIYLPLVAVNAVVISQVQSVSWTSTPGPALADAAGRAAGFLVGLVLIAVLREAIGTGTVTLMSSESRTVVIAVPGLSGNPIAAVHTSAGAFLIVGYLAGLVQAVRLRRADSGEEGRR